MASDRTVGVMRPPSDRGPWELPWLQFLIASEFPELESLD